MLDVKIARQKILENDFPLSSECVSLTDLYQRVLAQDIYARRSNPIQDISMMDGYAIGSKDTNRFKIVGEEPAGENWEHQLSENEALRIFTGSRIPEGTKCVVMQENVEYIHEKKYPKIILREPLSNHDFIRRKGSDFQKKDLLFKKGHRLTARDIGLLASAGIVWAQVAKPPQIAIIATGNEIAMPGMAHSHRATYNSGAFIVYALSKKIGAQPHFLPIARDDKNSLLECFANALHYDVIVTLGGVSVGDYDLVASTLKDEKFQLLFHKIAMKPGKPFLYGRMNNLPLFGLPGNPVAAYVCTLLFIEPTLRKLMGEKVSPTLPLQSAILGRDLPQNGPRMDFMRATMKKDANGQAIATPLASQDSAQQYHLAISHCLVVRSPHAAAAQKGENCQIMMLR